LNKLRLTPEEVERVAELARLHLTAEEKEKYAQQLSAVLDYFHMLQNLEAAEVSPTSHALLLENVLRDDETEESLSIDQVLGIAPDHREQLIAIPRLRSES
jgi:aspartyl-tRNA(Asn)/glutamyl-tRNA(Gln) amidotransferase subunit C